jgi:hypothetical protein
VIGNPPQTWKNNDQNAEILKAIANPDLNRYPISHVKLAHEKISTF